MPNRPIILLVIFLCFTSSGCSGLLKLFNIGGIRLDLTKQLEEIKSSARASMAIQSTCSRQAPTSRPPNSLMQDLPQELRQTKIVDTLAEQYSALLDYSLRPVVLAVDTSDFEEVVTALSNTLYDPADAVFGPHSSTTNLFYEYFKAYISLDGFVDSRGTQLAKPRITAQGIGNETISAIMTIFLEAAADSALSTPVLCVKDPNGVCQRYINPGATKPTRARFFPEEGISSGLCSITRDEAGWILFLSEMAADQAEVVSGLIVEAFGGGEAGFILAGHFSVGDNSTLSTIAKTFFENLFRRATTHAFYKAFKNN